MKKIVIYPGRFQPMLSHHVQVFKKLEQTYPDAEIYIGTSNKVEGVKSPFNFNEKQKIAQAHGLDPKKILLANRPYHKDDYNKYFNEDNVAIIFAVGEKDLDRFPFNNVDEKTGLDMTVRGEARPKYYQKINTYKQDPQPMATRGYITIAPTIKVNDEEASASAFRSALQNAPSEETAKEFFTKQFGEFNQEVFNLVYNKIKGSKMNEDINRLRQLAGLPLEEAPVEFDTAADPKAVTFLEPSANSAKMSIANRFPADVNPNDPEVKQEQFIQALIKSPANLLSEINERLDPKDANNEAVGTRLNKIISELGSGAVAEKGIGDLAEEDKKFVISVVKVAINDMDLIAGDDSEPEFDDEPEDEYQDWDDEVSKSNKTSAAVGNIEPIEDSVDLSDIKSEYGVEEGRMSEIHQDANSMDKEEFAKEHPMFADEWEGMQDQDDPDEPSQEEMDKHAKKESAPFGEPSQQDMMADELNDAYEKGGEEELAKAMGLSIEELDQEMTEFAMDHNLHMDDDRDEVIHGYIAQVVDNADFKDHGEYESIEEDEKDSWTGSTKDGHKYKAVADDQDGSQYLKVFYGDGKYFKIYYDSNHIGGKAGGYDHTQVAPETNDPRAEKVFADLPDDFFDKYGSEGETGLEDIIDMIKSVDESLEEGVGEYSYTLEYNGEENGYAKHKLTITSPEGETKEVADDFTYFDVEGDELQAELESWFHKGMGVADASVDEAVDSTINNAFDAAIQELRTLSGLNS